jgi:hypothetical protein
MGPPRFPLRDGTQTFYLLSQYIYGSTLHQIMAYRKNAAVSEYQ